MKSIVVTRGSTEYEFDKAKQSSNLEKHGYDLADSYLVYDADVKVTFESDRGGEKRWQDLALVEVEGRLLALAYTVRERRVRPISLRRANQREMRIYAARIAN